jgi:hypothetical protein
VAEGRAGEREGKEEEGEEEEVVEEDEQKGVGRTLI